mmetsp:Transcript_21920/g.54256  ORF Transcript_21920/g.54256 Transcript_21920/m.54256 type:complete len:485 (+) Transcript_21920:136-1590(+)
MSLKTRHASSKASSQSDGDEHTILYSYDNGKGKKKSNLTVVFLGSIVLLSLGAFVVQGGNYHRSQSYEHSYQESNVRKAKPNNAKNASQSKSITINNPYEGWQPAIHQDKNSIDCKSWRTCFTENSCPQKCRNSLEDFGQAPPRPNAEWVPDVTVLRRMLKDGHDHEGNSWPPPLVTDTDRELCEEIGDFGGPHDKNMGLLNAVPIRGMPLLSDWSDAAMTTKKMGRQPKVLCMVYTMEENHHTNIRAIRETWGPGCDGFLAFSTRDDPRIPAISLKHEGKEEYSNMWQKVRSIWRFVGTHYLEDFDFFFQGGEDLYVLPQNLRSVLADLVEDPTTEDFFGGRRFQWGKGSDVFFNSGGAGYALSQATLRKLIDTGLDHPDCFPHKHSSMEDVFIARCLKDAFGIGLVDTRDDQERERFHPFGPGGHYNWRPPEDGKKDWYQNYNLLWPPKLGKDCCAPDSVSFHYLKKPAMVRHIHALLYFCD